MFSLVQCSLVELLVNIDKLYLQCESFNIGLYERHGFRALHQAKHHRVETTVMVWSAAT